MHSSCKNQDQEPEQTQIVHPCQTSIHVKETGKAFQHSVQSLRDTKTESDIVNHIFGISSASDKSSKHIDSCSKRANKKTFCVATVKNKEHVVIFKRTVQCRMDVPNMPTMSMPAQKSAVTSTVLTFGHSSIQWQQNETLYQPKSPVFERAITLPYNATGSSVVDEIGFFGISPPDSPCRASDGEGVIQQPL